MILKRDINRIISVLMLLSLVYTAAGYMFETDFNDVKAIAAVPGATSTNTVTTNLPLPLLKRQVLPLTPLLHQQLMLRLLLPLLQLQKLPLTLLLHQQQMLRLLLPLSPTASAAANVTAAPATNATSTPTPSPTANATAQTLLLTLLPAPQRTLPQLPLHPEYQLYSHTPHHRQWKILLEHRASSASK